MKASASNTLAVAALVLAALTASELQASIVPIYSNFPFDRTAGAPLNTDQPYIAASFSPSRAGTLDHVVVPLLYQPGDPTLQVYLYGSSGGGPGTMLANLGSIEVQSSQRSARVFTTQSIAHEGQVLALGQTYWLVLENPNPGENPGISWAFSTFGSGGYDYSTDGSDWLPIRDSSASPAFKVYTPCPFLNPVNFARSSSGCPPRAAGHSPFAQPIQ
jgi:hypothetical protein